MAASSPLFVNGCFRLAGVRYRVTVPTSFVVRASRVLVAFQ